MRFVREVLGAEPWARQVEILEALARESRVSVRSCNGAGKTLCAAWAALWFLYSRPNVRQGGSVVHGEYWPAALAGEAVAAGMPG